MSPGTIPSEASKVLDTQPLSERVDTKAAIGLRLFDITLLAAFLGLTFLLGAFPLKDTDFWWHLRTGDLIRQTGVIPTADTYTFLAEGQPWIDLHWLFQVGISWVYEHGGVPALTLAKCAITTLAVLLLVTARSKDWPIWVSVLAWLPALLVLSGRMYVRPETLTLLYLAIDLAILTRLHQRPWLALGLPVVQIAWVNTQGLFVFGPVLIVFTLIDAWLSPRPLAMDRARWWKLQAVAAFLTGLACLVNPYGFRGALYPIELAKTMGNPIFSQNIAELTPIPEFIKRDVFIILPFRLHLATIAVAVLSFFAPMVWVVLNRIRATPASAPVQAPRRPPSRRKKKASSRPSVETVEHVETGWRLSPLRLLLFGAFTWLSWQATRNSHQFAAVVGSLTAWNFAEWAGAIERRRQSTGSFAWSRVVPRVVGLLAVGGLILWVATGGFYFASREGRTIGLGEEPLWYPHEAVKFAGGPGMPDRFLGFHIGHAALYEYSFAPERKVYIDPRLEVMGADLFERYINLEKRISSFEDNSWGRELDAAGRPAVLVDLANDTTTAAGMLASRNWRCVWFDPIAAVFVHESYNKIVSAHEVDFLARHFHPDPAFEPTGTSALLAMTKNIGELAYALARGGPRDLRGFVLLGSRFARQVRTDKPDNATAWKLTGVLEMLREPGMGMGETPPPRFRMPFDPVFDLSFVRATYALRRALELNPEDFKANLLLDQAFKLRQMSEAELTALEQLVRLKPINNIQLASQSAAETAIVEIRNQLGSTPPPSANGKQDLARIVSDLLASGRAETAADTLEKDQPANTRSWAETDRIATLRLHLGETRRAETLWRNAASPPRSGLRESRIGFAKLAEGAISEARESFRAAIALDPEQFDAHYGLAVLEQDLGQAAEALAAATRAESVAPRDSARSAAQEISRLVKPYARAVVEGSPK